MSQVGAGDFYYLPWEKSASEFTKVTTIGNRMRAFKRLKVISLYILTTSIAMSVFLLSVFA